MIALKIDSNADGVAQFMRGVARDQVPFALAKTLTKTVQAVQGVIPSALERDLDRPTNFTKRGTFISAARKTDLTATVGFKDRQATYLKYQVEGGLRAPTKVALRLPGNVTLDTYGNLPKDTIKKLIEAAKAGRYGGGVKRRLGIGGRRKGQGALSLFYGQPAHHPTWPVGIYRRVPGTSGGPGKLIPVIVFPKKNARYKPRFDFYGLAEKVVRREIGPQFARAYADALRTAR